MRPEWWDRAACLGTDPNIFFLELGESSAEAKAICARCPVIDECLADAVANKETYGIRGGLTPKERRPGGLAKRGRPRNPAPVDDAERRRRHKARVAELDAQLLAAREKKAAAALARRRRKATA